MSFLSNSQVILGLLLSAFVGAIIGLEREYRRKAAGLRTYSLVCFGAALFTILGAESFGSFYREAGAIGVNPSFDPSRVVAAVVMGVGFLGAGLIMHRDSHVEGLTTAAGLWITAAIGATIGSGFYFIGTFAGFLAIGILSGLRVVEEKLFHKD